MHYFCVGDGTSAIFLFYVSDFDDFDKLISLCHVYVM